jgi:hypothetical protein
MLHPWPVVESAHKEEERKVEEEKEEERKEGQGVGEHLEQICSLWPLAKLAGLNVWLLDEHQEEKQNDLISAAEKGGQSVKRQKLRGHMSAYVSIRQRAGRAGTRGKADIVCESPQHTSAYVSIHSALFPLRSGSPRSLTYADVC